MRKIGLWLTAGALVLYPVQAPGQTTPLPVAVPSPAQPGRVQVPALPRSPEASPPPPAGGREPSLYLRCDGHPNNMTGLEAFTRLVALSFVVGLMAPAPENDDPDKRLFGTAGVAACTTLLDDPTRHEGNGLRRIPLVLARAVHNIEAKNYTAFSFRYR